jgi:hypothetical protein
LGLVLGHALWADFPRFDKNASFGFHFQLICVLLRFGRDKLLDYFKKNY